MTRNPEPAVTQGNESTLELQRLLQDHIPLARATGASIKFHDDTGLGIVAPLHLNNNHHGTAFGGSLYVVALAAGWGLMHLLIRDADVSAALYVKTAQADYLRPVTQDLYAFAAAPPPTRLNEFLQELADQGRSEMKMNITMENGGKPAFRLEAVFAAQRKVSA